MDEVNFKQARIDKLEKIKALGWNAYATSFDKNHSILECLQNEGKKVKTAGKLFSFREHGNIAFADLKDETGKIQLFFQKKVLGDEAYKNLKLLDIGDYIGVEGEVVRTTAGEISIAPSSYTLLTKALLPLPSEFYDIKDKEIRLRKRYLDLIMHPELREIFKKKMLFWQSMRNYLIKKGFLEVETPVLQLIPGGADARPFITHHNAQDMDLYLRISLELPLKRLLVGGFEKVFEMGRIFRNEGIDDEHLQDYTQLEFYWAYADYNHLMDFLQDMYQTVIQETFGTMTTTWKGHEIDWSGDWPRKTYTELLDEHWHVDTEKITVEELYALAKKLNVTVDPNLGKGRLLDYLYKKTIRPDIIQPMFVINHPVEVEPLAKRIEGNPNFVERTQILAMGSELGKGFSELNDPIDQKERFEEQMRLRDAGDEEAQMMDADYVEALEYGMPPAAGFGVSERLFAMLVDRPVREVVFFPTMKPEKNISISDGSIISENVKVESKGLQQDFSHKVAIIVRKDLPSWQIMNAVAHVSAYLGNKMNEHFGTGDFFETKDGEKLPRNSQYPIIILEGDKKNLHSVRKEAQTTGMSYLAFNKDMIETTNDKKLEKMISEQNLDVIDIYAIGFFGENEAVEKITKQFTLWK